MSSLSRRSLRQKNVARRCLEKAVENEIDEFIQTNGRDAIDREMAEVTEFENYQIYDELSELLDYDDEPPYYEEWDDECDLYDDWSIDDGRDFPIIYSSFVQLQVGTYYKDGNNRTFLCCMIDYQKRLINVHTGLEAKAVIELKKIG